MRCDSGATQKVKEKMREAMTRHFTGAGETAQAAWLFERQRWIGLCRLDDYLSEITSLAEKRLT
jgi:hypothetical protein